jgi:ABC-type multidrug transport system ATPase subunit
MIELISVFLNGEHGPILNDFELKLRAGEVVSIVGTSGGGKSMVLRLASGALRPNRGRLRLGGRDVTNHLELLRKETALSTPELVGPYDLSVAGWMNYWSSVRRLPAKNLAERESNALATFGLLEMREFPVSMLSHGQKRCLDLARVWAIDPNIYLLDNPDAHLDGVSFHRLRRAIRKLHDRGKTVLISTTYPNLPYRSSQKVVHMKNGAIVNSCLRDEEDFQVFIYKAQGWR